MKPVAAALALALSAVTAYAAPTPNQMPGRGIVSALQFGTGSVQVNGGGGIPVGTSILGLTNGSRIDIVDKVVLTWGCSALSAACPAVPAVDPINPSGFNLGASATLFFGAVTAGSAVLNIDVSGNNSQLYGNLISVSTPWAGCPACAFAPAVFVANTNGIIMAPGSRMVIPMGGGLIGANMNSALQINDFVANNGWIVPAPQTVGTSYVDVVGGQSQVDIGGAINGDFILNTPAAYIFVAGGNINVQNTGNLFANKVVVNAGMIATPTSAAVGGVAGQTVNRLWNVDSGNEQACCFVGPLAGDLQIGAAGSNFVNLGSVSSKMGGPFGPAFITVQASGNIRSGTLGDTNNQVGFFADAGIYLDSYSNTSKIELYNVVSGYSTNRVLPFLYINKYAYFSTPFFSSDVTIQTILPGVGQPSTISTTGPVSIYGGNIAINSTINHKNLAGGGTQGNYDLTIVGSKSVTITANVGAGADVLITDNGGPLVISGNVVSDTNSGGAGGIFIENNMEGATTVISGNLTVPASAGSYNDLRVGTYGPTTISGITTNVNGSVHIYNYGTSAGNFTTISGNVVAGLNVEIGNSTSLQAKPLVISGNITSGGETFIYNNGSTPGESTLISGNITSTGDSIFVYNNGLATSMLTITGTLNANNDVNMGSNGNAQVRAVTAGNNIFEGVGGIANLIDGPWAAGNSTFINAPIAFTKLKPAGVISSPEIVLNVLNFQGVNAAGNQYTNVGQKPAAQLVTNDLDLTITGSINAGVSGNTNWPLNSMDIMPFFGLSPVLVSITANGGGFQAVNLRVIGDGTFDSGGTTTPFIGVPLTTGGLPAGGIQGNLGSQLILQTTGAMLVNGTPTFTLFGPATAFQWPGGAAFISGTTLQTTAPIYNAWSTDSPPFGGVFFVSPFIALGSFIATSGTAWANFSSAPVTGFPTVYQIHNLTPTTFGFVANPFAVVKNDYTHTVIGGPICTTTGPTTFAVCP